VFQFQNVAFTHNMNNNFNSTGGYAASEMRTWLTDEFLPGLIAAGVPFGVLWGPTRLVANGASDATAADPINDLLWLPTEREMYGSRTYSNIPLETAVNQARLAYYGSPASRIKYISSNEAAWYWEASPTSSAASARYFCNVSDLGNASYFLASLAEGGVAPAFCVK
jgi:hypothetical protein